MTPEIIKAITFLFVIMAFAVCILIVENWRLVKKNGKLAELIEDMDNVKYEPTKFNYYEHNAK